MNCPRCSQALVRSHDEWVCMTHGTIEAPTQERPMSNEIDELSADDMTQMLRKRLGSLGRQAQEAMQDVERCRSEASKLVSLLDALGETVSLPEVLQVARKTKKRRSVKLKEPVACLECGKTFDTNQGLAMHRTRVGCQQ